MRGRIVASIRAIDRAAWDRCFPGEAESHAYYAACEAAGPANLAMAAATVEDESGLVAAAPLFGLAYRLDTSLQGSWRWLGDALARRAPKLVSLGVLGFGSPYAERCHIGFAPHLDQPALGRAAEALLRAVEEQAEAEGSDLVAFKDLDPETEAFFASLLRTRRFARLASLPVAVLDLPFAGEEAYLASLSAATRKDIRRKLRASNQVRIEERTDIAGLEAEIEALYASTRLNSELDYGDFEVLPPGYFAAVSRALGPRAVFMLYWIGDTLAAFNLLLVEEKRVIDKFLGMRYPLAREHNLYAVSWVANVRFCLGRGIRLLQTGQTAYASKLRLGSRLVPSTIHFRHRRRLANGVLKALSPFFAFDRSDPDLKAVCRKAA